MEFLSSPRGWERGKFTMKNVWSLPQGTSESSFMHAICHCRFNLTRSAWWRQHHSCRVSVMPSMKNEPPHDKTNKVSVRPAKTQISLGIRPVWSESSLSAWRNLGSLANHWAQTKTLIRLGGCPGWSESSLDAHSFCWLCRVVAQILTALRHLHLLLTDTLGIAGSVRSGFG